MPCRNFEKRGTTSSRPAAQRGWGGGRGQGGRQRVAARTAPSRTPLPAQAAPPAPLPPPSLTRLHQLFDPGGGLDLQLDLHHSVREGHSLPRCQRRACVPAPVAGGAGGPQLSHHRQLGVQGDAHGCGGGVLEGCAPVARAQQRLERALRARGRGGRGAGVVPTTSPARAAPMPTLTAPPPPPHWGHAHCPAPASSRTGSAGCPPERPAATGGRAQAPLTNPPPPPRRRTQASAPAPWASAPWRWQAGGQEGQARKDQSLDWTDARRRPPRATALPRAHTHAHLRSLEVASRCTLRSTNSCWWGLGLRSPYLCGGGGKARPAARHERAPPLPDTPPSPPIPRHLPAHAHHRGAILLAQAGVVGWQAAGWVVHVHCGGEGRGREGEEERRRGVL